MGGFIWDNSSPSFEMFPSFSNSLNEKSLASAEYAPKSMQKSVHAYEVSDNIDSSKY